jgi:hypothetical protein
MIIKERNDNKGEKRIYKLCYLQVNIYNINNPHWNDQYYPTYDML